jgi:hypothetical protein
VREGTRVAAGTPLLQMRNIELEREIIASRRINDSLAVQAAGARGRERFADVALLEADREVEGARLKGLHARAAALQVRSVRSGMVLTRRPEELLGRWVAQGEVVLDVANTDSLEVRMQIAGAGGTQVKPGHAVRLLSDATLDAPLATQVSQVSAAATSPQQIEVRVRLPATDGWRPGVTGKGSIALRRSNVWGALWWSIRRGIRSDILL